MLSSSANRNTLEYRKEISKAARQLVPDILAEAGGMSSWQDILNGFKARRPDLSDDALPCQCGNRHPQWEHCVATAMQGLKRAQVVEHPARGVWRLATDLPPVPKPPLAPASPITARPPISGQPARTPVAPPPPAEPPASVAETSIREEIVAKLSGMNDRQFEAFVGRLLEELGYADVDVVGRSGDGGVDVTCVLKGPLVDPPLSVVCQVKRHATNIGPSAVGDLRGRWAHRADRLILINTAGFTQGAREAAREPGAKEISLVTGEDLADLMIQKGIGVSREPVVVEKLDEAFFSEFSR